MSRLKIISKQYIH